VGQYVGHNSVMVEVRHWQNCLPVDFWFKAASW